MGCVSYPARRMEKDTDEQNSSRLLFFFLALTYFTLFLVLNDYSTTAQCAQKKALKEIEEQEERESEMAFGTMNIFP